MTKIQITSSGITIKAITADRWVEWRKLRLHALEEASHAFCATLAEWQGENDTELRWRARLETVPCNFLAFEGPDAVGMVSGFLPNKNREVNLISMWVAPEKRGLSIGNLLIASIVIWAIEQHALRLCLDVKKNNHAAIALYTRNGFLADGTAVAQDEQHMYLPLQV